ncbi:unnamed protein product (macronuclear) [Paramecium tetraurelia]|uniref:Uncharacterized protein n=1 Tax=Paramecium tetraurelia TaxID=5888 RepID=A0C614_PARTE|nr:uncharacterized protein GSPATT00035360001 [Paramecium tetraurelia]CAK66231.1 unnamed protein product [Paramecium tetraurelia]|eukprot:XP_001433628.1 hypothetical protein (macronuclear) [Paramecium tetraurelia strain d4-2]
MIVQKQILGSGGFKMSAEIETGNKSQQQHINNDLPTKNELFNQLGNIRDDDSVKANNDHRWNHFRISKQLIQITVQQEQLNYLPSKPPTPQVIKQEVSTQRLTSQRIRENAGGAKATFEYQNSICMSGISKSIRIADIFSSQKVIILKNTNHRGGFLICYLTLTEIWRSIKTNDHQFKVTRPQPFNFDKREKDRSFFIREGSLRNVRRKEENQFMQSFKAKAVPQIVKQDGLYEKILNDNEKLTLKNKRPISFYKRDKNSSRMPRKKQKQYLDMLMWNDLEKWNKMKSQEIGKYSQTCSRINNEFQNAIQDERQIQGQPQSHNYMKTQISYKTKPIPDFEKLHSSFQDQINRNKLQMRTTKSEPFNFQQSRKGRMKQKSIQLRNIKPRQPPSMKKWENICEFLKQERIKKVKKLEQKSESLIIRRIQEIQKLEQQRKDRIAQLKKESKEQEMKQKRFIENCQRKPTEQPLLVERPTKRSVQLEKMKKLSKNDKILKQNGVMNRDEYFDKEEKVTILTISYLIILLSYVI